MTTVTTVTPAEPPTVTDPATAPLWHARRVTAGRAGDVTVVAELLALCGLLPAQLAGESAHLLGITDFDKARALLDETNEEDSMATALDIAPDIDTSPATIRTWAKEQRLRVSAMGKIPQAIENAYLAAHGIPLAEQAKIARPTAPGLDDLPVTVDEDAVTVTPPAVTPEPEPVTVEPVTVTPEPDAVTAEPDPVTVETGPIGTAIVAGWDGRHRVMRVDHSVRGEVGWIAVSAWPLARFGILFEDDEISDFVPDDMTSLVAEVEQRTVEFGAKVKLAQEQARTIERLESGGRELGRQIERYLTWVLDATGMHHLIDETGDGDWELVWERLAEMGREAARPAAAPPTVVSTLPGPLPDEIVELLRAWHALFEKADTVDTSAGHTLAEIAAPALVSETADQIHDLIRLLDGDVSR